MDPTLEALTRTTDWQTTFRIMAGAIFLVSLRTITFDPKIEEDRETVSCKDKEMEQDSGEKNRESTISKMLSLFDVSVWKEPAIIALFFSAFFVAFGHCVPRIHLVSDDKKFVLQVQKG